MSNILEFAHWLAANDQQSNIDAGLGSQRIKLRKLKKKTVLDLCKAPGSDGLKITLVTSPPDITIDSFKKNTPLLENEFAITKEVFENKEVIKMEGKDDVGPWITSNTKSFKVHICSNGNKLYLIINPSDDDGDGGDGLKVSIPFPPPGQ